MSAYGEAHPYAKLTVADVKTIRRLRSRVGKRPMSPKRASSLKALALRFGISVATVSQIANRRRWRHIP